MSEKRYVKLTPEQLRVFREADRKRSAQGKLLCELFDRISESMAEDGEEFWSQVHKIAGTTEDQCNLRMLWASGEVEITNLEHE